VSQELKTILILSTGRTGTMFLARLLGEVFPQAEVHHEAPGSRQINILANLNSAHLLPRSALFAWWRLRIGRSLARCSKPYYIDSNNFLFGLVAQQPYLYPQLRVIHLIRDPRTYVSSHLSWMQANQRSKIANHLIPFWQPNPFLIGELSLGEYIALSRFEKYCWVWSYKNRVIQSLQATEIPYLRVRFEELFDTHHSLETLQRMFDFAELPSNVEMQAGRFQQPVNASGRARFSKWNTWEPEQCRRLDRFCQPLMEQYGYGCEPEWQAKLAILDPSKARI
jgi:hypothetical protein